ncbi:Xin actin-binding repeat-containing protein 2, partial [Massospora cicadina]
SPATSTTLSSRSGVVAINDTDSWKQPSSKRLVVYTPYLKLTKLTAQTTVLITGQSKSCTVCHAPVYPAEQMLVDSFSLHPNCFRCHHCNQLLSLSSNEKAHYRLYSSGNGSLRTNPLFANARYSLAMSSPIEAHTAIGESIAGKKAAYESLVRARSVVHDRSRSESLSEYKPPPHPSPFDRVGRHERTKSMNAFPSGEFTKVGTKKTNGSASIVSSDFPVSKIVQNRLRFYERLDETEPPVTPPSAVLRSSSTGGSASKIILEPSSPRASAVAELSPTYGSLDPSFAAAHRTKLRSRIKSYQEKSKADVDSDARDSTLARLSRGPEEGSDGRTPGKLTRTFKDVVDALISYGRQNKAEIGIRENLVRYGTSRSSRPASTSPDPQPVAPAHHPTIVHAEGEVSYRQLDSDLNKILEQVTLLSPPVAVRDSIQEAIFAVDQKLAVSFRHFRPL